MVIVRPLDLTRVKYDCFPYGQSHNINPGFIVHPSTSELAERLQVDSTALSEENYSGIYDENGDFIPQYCDDPDKIPQGGLNANSEASGTAGGARAPGDDNSASTADPDTNDNS